MTKFLQDLLNEYSWLASVMQYDNAENILSRRKLSAEYYKWASKHPHIHTNSDTMPRNVMKKNRVVQIVDFRIQCKRGLDDAVYEKHEDLRRKLARGNTILQVCDGPDSGFYLCIYALKKFTGQSPLDDDDRTDDMSSSIFTSEAMNLYFTEPCSEAHRVVSTWKANGEACHLAAISIEGEILYITGTKNTHMVVKCRDDISKYSSNRYQVCKQFAEAVFDMLDSMEEDLRISLVEFLRLSGWTVVFEILNSAHQHVEDLSSVKQPTLHFIAWTSTDPEFSALTAIPPDTGIELARKFGLQVVNYSLVALKDVPAHCEEVKRTNYREGNVLYYLNGKGETIGLVKKKTAWYVLCRAIREKAKVLATGIHKMTRNSSVSAAINKTHKRIDVINGFLGISLEELVHWKMLAEHFLRYVSLGVTDGSIECDAVYNRFPVLWRRCMTERHLDDSFIEFSPTPAQNKLPDENATSEGDNIVA